MTEINFKSTYRIPITQAGINPAKKTKLRELVAPYRNKLVSKSNAGTVRISIPNEDDAKFLQQLKGIGYKVLQVFEGESVKTGKLAEYIKEELALGNYKQIGKQKKQLSTNAKKKRYNAILERKQKIEEEKRIAEARELAQKERAAKEAVKQQSKFDQYDTDFDFEDFEIK